MNAKPKIIFITAILTIIMLLNTVPSIAQGEKVAYILKNVNNPNSQIMSVLTELGLQVTKIDDSKIPTTNFNSYDLVLMGNELISNEEKLPVGDKKFIAVDSFNAVTWGFSASVGQVGSNVPLIAENIDTNHFITKDLSTKYPQVYNSCCYNGASIPMFYLSGQKAFPSQQRITIVPADTGKVVIAAIEPGVRLFTGKVVNERAIFFGITETNYWTSDARKLFKNSVQYALYGGDQDGDGILDSMDNCPSTSNANQANADGDSSGDACDVCADDPNNDVDNDKYCIGSRYLSPKLGANDNCPNLANPDQLDNEADGLGNACDPDDDNDGISDFDDNCQFIPNTLQNDTDNDNIGDACDAKPFDFDNDGHSDLADNCLNIYNPDQSDVDNDGIGDVCDASPNDNDNDGVIDSADNCLNIVNPDQKNTDNDAMGDVCDSDDDNDGINDLTDNCELIANADQADFDEDNKGDVCDSDRDGDHVNNTIDNCQSIRNLDQQDLNSNNVGDACEVKINEFTLQPITDWNEDNTVDDSDRFVELYNQQSERIEMDGWKLIFVEQGQMELENSINANSYFIKIPLNATIETLVRQPIDLSIFLSSGRLVLLDNFGQLIDSVSYGIYDDGNVADNAVDVSSTSKQDECLARSPNGADTDNDANDFRKQACRIGFSNDADITPPVVTLLSPEDNVLIAESFTNLTFKASDNNAAEVFCTLYTNVSGNFSAGSTVSVQNNTESSFSLDELDDAVYRWNVKCHDGNPANAAFAAADRLFTINEPDGPILSITPANITLNENDTLIINASATDADGDLVTITINDTARFIEVPLSLTEKNFEWHTGFFDAGQYRFLITATDGMLNATLPVIVTVNNANREPVLTSPIPTIVLDEDSYYDQLNLSEYFNDPDLDRLTFDVSSLNSSDVRILLNDGAANISSSANFYGTAIARFKASDGEREVESNNVTIEVNPVNDKPRIDAIPAKSVVESQTLTFILTSSDVDGDVITYSTNAGALFGNLATINSTSGLFRFTPDNSVSGGNYIVEFAASDGNLLDKTNATISVTPAVEIRDVVATINPTFNVNDGSVIPVKPGQTVNLALNVKNNIAKPVYGLNILGKVDSTLNIEDAEYINELLAGQSKPVTLSFTIPTILSAGFYDLNISINGIDIDHLAHSDRFGFILNVTKDKDEIKIEKAEFDPSTIACSGQSKLKLNMTNIGSFDQDGAVIKVRNAALGLNETLVRNIPMNSYLYEEIAVEVPNNLAVGSYNTDISVEYFFVKQAGATAVLQKQACGIITSSPSDTNLVISDHGKQEFRITIPSISGLSTQWKLDDANVGSQGDLGLNVTGSVILIGTHNVSVELSYSGNVIDSRAWKLTVVPNRAPSANAGVDRTEFVNTTVNLDGTSSSDTDNDNLTYSWNFVSGPEQITLTNPTNARPSFTSNKLGVYEFSLVVNDGMNSSNADNVRITVAEKPRLEIIDLDVSVDDEDDKNLRNGDKISDEAMPGDKVSFELEVANNFERNSDHDIEDVEVEINILNIDDGDDLDEDSEQNDIDAGDSEDFDVDFEIPYDAEEDIYDVEIRVTGDEKDTNIEHEIIWNLRLEVEREKHDIRIISTSLNPQTVNCERRSTLNIFATNIGQDDEDESSISIFNEKLKLDIREEGIELDNKQDDSDSRYINNYNIDAGKAEPGTYPITVTTYYDSRSISDSQTLNLKVDKCTVKQETEPLLATPDTTAKTTKKKSSESVVLKYLDQGIAGAAGMIEAVTISEPATFVRRNVSNVVILLILAIILITGLILYLAGYIAVKSSKNGKKKVEKEKLTEQPKARRGRGKNTVLTNF